MNCLRCEGPLEPGFIDAGSTTEPTAWVRGEAEYTTFGVLQTRGKQMFTIAVSRCTNCGRLELSTNEQIQ